MGCVCSRDDNTPGDVVDTDGLQPLLQDKKPQHKIQQTIRLGSELDCTADTTTADEESDCVDFEPSSESEVEEVAAGERSPPFVQVSATVGELGTAAFEASKTRVTGATHKVADVQTKAEGRACTKASPRASPTSAWVSEANANPNEFTAADGARQSPAALASQQESAQTTREAPQGIHAEEINSDCDSDGEALSQGYVQTTPTPAKLDTAVDTSVLSVVSVDSDDLVEMSVGSAPSSPPLVYASPHHTADRRAARASNMENHKSRPSPSSERAISVNFANAQQPAQGAPMALSPHLTSPHVLRAGQAHTSAQSAQKVLAQRALAGGTTLVMDKENVVNGGAWPRRTPGSGSCTRSGLGLGFGSEAATVLSTHASQVDTPDGDASICISPAVTLGTWATPDGIGTEVSVDQWQASDGRLGTPGGWSTPGE